MITDEMIEKAAETFAFDQGKAYPIDDNDNIIALNSFEAGAKWALEQDLWQPIETAPKSSKAIMVYCEERKNIYTVTWGKVGAFWNLDGWRYFGCSFDLSETPTHWQPLPEPPKI